MEYAYRKYSNEGLLSQPTRSGISPCPNASNRSGWLAAPNFEGHFALRPSASFATRDYSKPTHVRDSAYYDSSGFDLQIHQWESDLCNRWLYFADAMRDCFELNRKRTAILVWPFARARTATAQRVAHRLYNGTRMNGCLAWN